MKNHDTIERTTLNALFDSFISSDAIEDLRFLYKEIVHFVDLDAFGDDDQTSMYFLDEITDLLSELYSIGGIKQDNDESINEGLIIIEKIKKSAAGDLIKYLDNITDLAVFHISYDQYSEKTRGALHSLKYIKEALSPLITESYPSEEVKLLREQLLQSQAKIKELESKVKRNG